MTVPVSEVLDLYINHPTVELSKILSNHIQALAKLDKFCNLDLKLIYRVLDKSPILPRVVVEELINGIKKFQPVNIDEILKHVNCTPKNLIHKSIVNGDRLNLVEKESKELSEKLSKFTHTNDVISNLFDSELFNKNSNKEDFEKLYNNTRKLSHKYQEVSTENTVLQNKVASLYSKLATYESKYNTLDLKISDLTMEKAELEKTISRLESENSLLEKKRKEDKEKLYKMKCTVDKLNNKCNKVENHCHSLELNSKTNSADYNHLLNEKLLLEKENLSLKNESDSMRDLISELKDTLDKSVKKIEELTHCKNTLIKENEQLRNAVTISNGKQAISDQKLSELTSQNRALQNDYQYIKTKLEKLGTKHLNLTNRVDSLEFKNSSLKHHYNILESRYYDVKDRYNDVVDEYLALKYQ